ncbi:MAG TPA: hypothetical protein VF219_13130, partial [Vicinamibacterales bacterium]
GKRDRQQGDGQRREDSARRAPGVSHGPEPALGGVGVVSADSVVAVPYYAWGNRGKGEMAVWIPYR